MCSNTSMHFIPVGLYKSKFFMEEPYERSKHSEYENIIPGVLQNIFFTN